MKNKPVILAALGIALLASGCNQSTSADYTTTGDTNVPAAATNTWQKTKEATTNAWENVKEGTTNAMENTKEAATNAWSGIKQGGGSVTN